MECHSGIEEMHASPYVILACVDCHGGDPTPGLTMRKAHVAPRNPVFWQSSAKPSDSSVLLNHESPEFIRFVNPADLRVADKACGLCHGEVVSHVGSSMMNHGAMLWEAALYNNGASPSKDARYGQAYGSNGEALRLESPVPVTPDMTLLHGILPYLEPLPRFEIGQPSNILRVFEKGGEKQEEIGNPDPFEEPGHPARRLSERGLGTLNRIDPVFLNLQKTRLNDPHLGFMGSNDHAGDYRSSGCAACHVIYANDRSPDELRAGGRSTATRGSSFTGDPMISKREKAPPDRPPVHAQHTVEPVHDLPHAPGKPLREFLPRLHVVGPGERRGVHVPAGAEESHGGGDGGLPPAKPRGRRRPGASGATPTSSRRSPR